MKFAALIFVTCLLIVGTMTVGFAWQQDDGSQAKIVELEKRLADLECRHVLFEDGSTLHKDAEAVAECVYTAPVYARYGD